MKDQHKFSIFIVSGKNPLLAKSGYASYAYNLAKIITSLGYSVEIFCLGVKNEVIESKIGTINIIGSKLFSTLLKDVEMAGLLFFAPKLALAMVKKLKSNYHVIIWGIGPWSLTGVLVKIFGNKRRVILSDYFTTVKHEFLGTMSAITARDYGVMSKLRTILTYLTVIQLYTLLERFLLKLSDKVVTHYQSTEKILKEQFDIESTRFIRLPYLVEIRNTSKVDQDIFEVAALRKPLIICVSRHDGRKGINFLLHAFSILNSKKVKYFAVIIGTGKLRGKHFQLAKKLGLSNVYQPGFVEDIRPYFKKADLFVLPSIEEGSSALVILEAMKEGLPIVSTNVDGMVEDLIHGKSALLVPSKDPKALADGMEKLLKNPPLAQKLGLAAKKEYQKKYNRRKVIKEISRFLIE